MTEESLLTQLKRAEDNSAEQQQIIGRHIAVHGKLDITESFQQSLTLSGVVIFSDVKIVEAELLNGIRFNDCRVLGGFHIEKSSVEYIQVEKSVFAGEIHVAKGANIKTLEFTGCHAGKFIAQGEASLKIGGLKIINCTFDQGLEVLGTEAAKLICKTILLDNVDVQDQVQLKNIESNNIDLTSLVASQLTFEHCNIANYLNLMNIRHEKDPKLRLSECNIKGDLSFANSKHAIKFELFEVIVKNIELAPHSAGEECTTEFEFKDVDISQQLSFQEGRYSRSILIRQKKGSKGGSFDLNIAKGVEFAGESETSTKQYFRIEESTIGKFRTGLDIRFASLFAVKNVNFLNVCEWEKSTFSAGCGFENCLFKRVAIFKGAIFEKSASFKRCTFEQNASFEDAEFCSADNDAMFTDAQFAGVTTLSGANFAAVPDFAETLFAHDPELERIRLPWQAFDFTSNEFKKAQRTSRDASQKSLTRDITKLVRLKAIAQKAQNYDLELRFFAIERKMRAIRKGRLSGSASWLYDFASDYGQSLLRPFRLLIVSFMLFATIHACLLAQDVSLLEYLALTASVYLVVVGIYILFINLAGEKSGIAKHGRDTYSRKNLAGDMLLIGVLIAFLLLCYVGVPDTLRAPVEKSLKYSLPLYRIYEIAYRSYPTIPPTGITALLEYFQFMLSLVLQFLFLLGIRNRFRISA